MFSIKFAVNKNRTKKKAFYFDVELKIYIYVPLAMIHEKQLHK